MTEFGLLDWIMVVAAIVVSWQIHVAVLGHLPPGRAERDGASAGSGVALVAAPTGLEALERIRKAGGYADLGAFLAGANLAYEEIVGAFATGDLQPVERLLGPAVREAFARAIAERQARQQALSTTLIGVSAEPVDAGLEDGTAWIALRFDAEMVCAVTDRGGNLVSGDPRHVVEIAEAWTFSRELGSPDPNWTLVATDEDA